MIRFGTLSIVGVLLVAPKVGGAADETGALSVRPPKLKDARFAKKAADQTIEIKTVYL